LVRFNGKVKSYSGWESVKKVLKDSQALKDCKTEEEGKELWEVIKKEMKEKDTVSSL